MGRFDGLWENLPRREFNPRVLLPIGVYGCEPEQLLGPSHSYWRSSMGDEKQPAPPFNMTDGLVEGRHVFYEDTDGTHAAIVAKCDRLQYADGTKGELTGTLTLMILDFNGGTFAKTGVSFDAKATVDGIVHDGNPTIGTWRWMYGKQGVTYTPGQKPGSLEPAFTPWRAPREGEQGYKVHADPAVKES